MMAQLRAQTLREKIHFSTNLTVGMPLADSDVKPLSLLASAEYQLHPRFSAGIGTGISKYDDLMLPVFATFHWQISKSHRFTPFLACNIGHAFVPKKYISGGSYLTPSATSFRSTVSPLATKVPSSSHNMSRMSVTTPLRQASASLSDCPLITFLSRISQIFGYIGNYLYLCNVKHKKENMIQEVILGTVFLVAGVGLLVSSLL
jgi:hypothetical protein